MEKAAASSAHQLLQVLLLVTLLAVTAAEYRPRQGPPYPPHMRGPPPHKSYSSPAKHHHNHHFHQNSYSGPPFPSKGAQQYNRPMRYRKPGPPTQMGRPSPSWENSSYKPSGLDRYKSPGHFSSGEPPASVSASSPSMSHLSSSGSLSSLGGLESFSSGMDFKHLNPDLSPIRTIPAPNLGPTSWPSAGSVGVGSLASQLTSQSPAVFPQFHHSLDLSDPSTTAALLASSKQHGYQVTESPSLYAPDPDPSRTSLLRAGLDSKFHNDLSLRLSPYTTMPQLLNQGGYSALSSLSSQDLFHLLNGFPLQQDAHSYLRTGQSAVTDAAQLQSQYQAQLQQAQLQNAQLQHAQLQQAQLQQAQLQQAQLQQSQLANSPSSLRFSFDEQNEQLLHSLPGRRGQHPHELEGADSSPVVRLYHNGARHPTSHEDSDVDSEVDGSEHTGISVSPSPTPAHEADDYNDGEPSGNNDEATSSDGDFNDPGVTHEEEEDVRPSRIRTRKNRDRMPSS